MRDADHVGSSFLCDNWDHLKIVNRDNKLDGPTGGPTLSQVSHNKRSYDVQIPAALANWAGSQTPQVCAIMLESYRTGKPLILTVVAPPAEPAQPILPNLPPGTLRKETWKTVALELYRTVYARHETVLGAVKALRKDLTSYRSGGAYKRHLEAGREPAKEPEASFHIILKLHNHNGENIPSVKTLQRLFGG